MNAQAKPAPTEQRLMAGLERALFQHRVIVLLLFLMISLLLGYKAWRSAPTPASRA